MPLIELEQPDDIPAAQESSWLATEVNSAPAWSPSGRSIAFINRDRIRLTDPAGTRTRTNVRLPRADIQDLTWSPDGKRLAFVAGAPPKD